LFALAACATETTAPWVTDPGIDGHAVYFPLSGTVHDPSGLASVTSCAGCHPGTSFREFVCVTCHTATLTDPLHPGVSGYPTGAATSADCYRCHPQGAGIAPADHGIFFPIGTPSHPPLCGACHTNAQARSDPATLACASCHAGRPGFTATAHAGVAEYGAIVSVTSPWCVRCHADDQVDRVAQHGAQRGSAGTAGSGDGRHGTRCFTCHSMIPPYFGGTGPGLPNRPWAQDWKQSTCSPCH
jgi:hypothetical protein